VSDEPNEGVVEETDFLGGPFPKKLADQFRSVAKANERSVAAELRVAVRCHIEKHNKWNGGAA
jgi:hypothetical protein